SDEILSLAEVLSLQQPMSARRVAVLADGGGHATIAADVLTEHGLVLATPSERTRQRLAAILPSAAAVANPVGVGGGTRSNPAVFADCARLRLADPRVDALLVTGLFGGYGVRFSPTLTEIEMQTSQRIAELQREFGKPVLVHSLYGSLYADLRPKPLALIRELGIPVYDSLERAVRCLLGLAEFGEARRRPLPIGAPLPVRSGRFSDVVRTCRREDRTVVLEPEARQALEDAGVQMPAPAIVARTADEAVKAHAQLGRVPVAMKVVSR